MPVLTRIYSPSDFAALTLFSQLVMGLAIVMTLRLEYLVMLPATSDEAWSVLRMTGLLGLGHVLVLTPVLYLAPLHWEWVAHQGTISTWLWLLPATAGVVSLAVAFQQIVQRGGDFKSSGLSEFLGRLAYVGCGLFGALALPSIVGLMASTIGNGLVKLAWLMRTAGRRNLAWLEGTRAPISSAIRRLALSTSLSNLISIFSGLAPMVYIGSTYGEAALGQYGLVVSTLYLPSTLLGQSIGQVYYQRASHIHATHQPFSSLLLATTKSLVIIGVPVYTLIALLAPAAYPLIFGANWSDAGSIARFLAFAALASFISTPLDKTSLIVRAWWYLTTWHAVRAAGTLIGLWYASAQQLAFEQCVLLIAAVSATCYLADWGASFGFTSRKPRHAESRNALEKREVP